jgi:hypothetical protein
MSLQSLSIFIAAYGVIGLLLLNLVFFTRWMWWVKLAAIAVVALLFHSTWNSMPALLGWPTDEGLPERFNLTALEVVEPDKSGEVKGEIYLWTTELNLDGTPRVPRAFAVPFHPELQAKLTLAGTKLRKNMPQVGERVTTPFESAAASVGHGKAPINLDFYDLPDPLFPEKAP